MLAVGGSHTMLRVYTIVTPFQVLCTAFMKYCIAVSRGCQTEPVNL